MASLKTDIAAAQQDYRGISKRPDGAKVTGKLGVLEAVYTATGLEVDADVFDIGDIPEGAVVLPELCRITSEACGGTGSAILTLGDSAVANRYSATSVSVASAATTAVTPTIATGIVVRTPVTADTKTIKGVFDLTSGAMTAGKMIVFTIVFRHP